MGFLSEEVMVVNNDLLEHGVEQLENTSQSRVEGVLKDQLTSKFISSA
jgi:hypothetical protein